MEPPISDLFTTNRPPTDEEYTYLTQHVDEQEIRLSELDKRISHLTKELQALEEERNTLVAAIAPVKQALRAPIRRVPEDVLREIFVACLDSNRNPVMSNMEAPVLLTQISSSMRKIALTTPALWAAIHIAITGNATDSRRMTEVQETMQKRIDALQEWLLRSGSLPLSISVFAQGENVSNSTAAVIMAICKFSFRWRSVLFSCSPEALVSIYALGLENFTLLQSVTFNLGRSQEGDPASTIACSAIMRSPKLTDLGLSFRGDISCFKDAVAWANLTHIRFPYPSFSAPTTMTMNDTAYILRQMTRLVTCDIFVSFDQLVYDEVHLPFLKTLTVFCSQPTQDVTGLLAAIRAPVLDVVWCNMENVDFLYHFHYPNALIELLKYSPSVTELAFGPGAKPSYIIKCLQHCPALRTLHIQDINNTDSDIPLPDSEILDALVPDEGRLCFCPKLENFRWRGARKVPPNRVQKFLEKKRRLNGTNFANWKTVILESVVNSYDLDTFTNIQNGELGRDTNFQFIGSLLGEWRHSVYDGIFKSIPTDSIWPSKVPRSYLWQ